MRLLGARIQKKDVFKILKKKNIQNSMTLAKPSGGVIVESRYFRTCQLTKNKLPATHLFFSRKLLASFFEAVIHKRGIFRIY